MLQGPVLATVHQITIPAGYNAGSTALSLKFRQSILPQGIACSSAWLQDD